MRIIFAGTPDFSVAALQVLMASSHEVEAVYTQPDRPLGRGRKQVNGPVKQVAIEHNIPVYQPLDFRSAETVEELQRLQADLMVVVAYGLILPQAVVDAPRLGCINIHASLLPRWRGAAPIQRAIIAADQQTGISIMQMDAGLDTGPVWLRREIAISVNETGSHLHDRLAQLGAEALMDALPLLGGDGHQATAQADEGVTYAHKLSKSEAAIEWNEPAAVIHRKVCAFNSWPVAYTQLGGKQLRVWESRLAGGDSRAAPGRVVNSSPDGIDIATGEGLLRIIKLQLPGKTAMSAADFLNAHTLDNVELG
jgi:methionyl-tRNA formyltransferase